MEEATTVLEIGGLMGWFSARGAGGVPCEIRERYRGLDTQARFRSAAIAATIYAPGWAKCTCRVEALRSRGERTEYLFILPPARMLHWLEGL